MLQPSPMIVQQPYTIVRQEHAVGVKGTRGLGITQMLIGGSTFLLGVIAIILLHYWAAYVGFGIWGGIWILVGGMLGVCSAANPTNACLNWTNMSFAIVSSCISFVQFIVYAVAVGQYNSARMYCSILNVGTCNDDEITNGLIVYVFHLIIMIAEFGVSLAVAICCCKYGCAGCCNDTPQQIYVQQQPHVMPGAVSVQHVSSSTGPHYPMSAQSQGAYAGQPQFSSAHVYPVSAPMMGSYAAPPPYSNVPTTGYPNQQQLGYAMSNAAANVNPVALTYNQDDLPTKRVDNTFSSQ